MTEFPPSDNTPYPAVIQTKVSELKAHLVATIESEPWSKWRRTDTPSTGVSIQNRFFRADKSRTRKLEQDKNHPLEGYMTGVVYSTYTITDTETKNRQDRKSRNIGAASLREVRISVRHERAGLSLRQLGAYTLEHGVDLDEHALSPFQFARIDHMISFDSAKHLETATLEKIPHTNAKHNPLTLKYGGENDFFAVQSGIDIVESAIATLRQGFVGDLPSAR